MCPPREEPDRMYFVGPPPFGPRGPHLRSRRRRGHRFGRARRGDVRAGILALLAEQPMHGYQIIQELESRSGGLWRASPGSVYPTLQLLEDEGLVGCEDAEGRRVYSLTEAGRTRTEDARDRTGRLPWEEFAEAADDNAVRLHEAVFQVGAAAGQTVHAGSEEQLQRVLEVLAETRRRIYAILAEQTPPE